MEHRIQVRAQRSVSLIVLTLLIGLLIPEHALAARGSGAGPTGVVTNTAAGGMCSGLLYRTISADLQTVGSYVSDAAEYHGQVRIHVSVPSLLEAQEGTVRCRYKDPSAYAAEVHIEGTDPFGQIACDFPLIDSDAYSPQVNTFQRVGQTVTVNLKSGECTVYGATLTDTSRTVQRITFSLVEPQCVPTCTATAIAWQAEEEDTTDLPEGEPVIVETDEGPVMASPNARPGDNSPDPNSDDPISGSLASGVQAVTQTSSNQSGEATMSGGCMSDAVCTNLELFDSYPLPIDHRVAITREGEPTALMFEGINMNNWLRPSTPSGDGRVTDIWNQQTVVSSGDAGAVCIAKTTVRTAGSLPAAIWPTTTTPVGASGTTEFSIGYGGSSYKKTWTAYSGKIQGNYSPRTQRFVASWRYNGGRICIMDHQTVSIDSGSVYTYNPYTYPTYWIGWEVWYQDLTW